MSDEKTTATEATEGPAFDDEMRPLPDGGLQTSMPEWLRRPPAWRELQRYERRSESSLPEPDTSIIDPRTLVDLADLPHWLQEIAMRSDVTQRPASGSGIDRSPEERAAQPDVHNHSSSEEMPERTIAFEPVDTKIWEIPQEQTKGYRGVKLTGTNNPWILVAMGLIVLLLLLVLLFAVVL